MSVIIKINVSFKTFLNAKINFSLVLQSLYLAIMKNYFKKTAKLLLSFDAVKSFQ